MTLSLKPSRFVAACSVCLQVIWDAEINTKREGERERELVCQLVGSVVSKAAKLHSLQHGSLSLQGRAFQCLKSRRNWDLVVGFLGLLLASI